MKRREFITLLGVAGLDRVMPDGPPVFLTWVILMLLGP